MKLLQIKVKFKSVTNLIRSQYLSAILLLFTVYPSILLAQNNYVFGSSIRVNDDPPGTRDHFMLSSGQHLMGCRGDTVYLVWSDERTNLRRIYFSRSIDCCNTWSVNLRLSSDDPNHEANAPSLMLDSQGNIYVCYGHYDWSTFNVDVYFTKSEDGGMSFTTPVLVNDTTRAAQDNPSIAVDTSGQIVYVAWQDTRNPVNIPNFDVYVTRSTDGGLTFGPSVRVDDTGSDSLDQQKPSIGCTQGGDTVYVVWWDERNGEFDNLDVYFSRSIDGGLTFEPNVLVNDTVGITQSLQWYPSLFVSRSGSIYIVWEDNRFGPYQVYFAKSIDCGLSFVGHQRVTDTLISGGWNPSIYSLNDSLVYVAWSEGRTYSQTGDDIYFSFSTDGGDTFNPNVRVNDLLGIEYAWDWYPSVCVNDSGDVFVAWESDRNDPSHANSDIYCAAGNYVGIQECSSTFPREQMVSIYPNPVRSVLSVHCAQPANFNIMVYDAIGRVLKEYEMEGKRSAVINCVDLAVGVYFIRFSGGDETIIKKIVKLK